MAGLDPAAARAGLRTAREIISRWQATRFRTSLWGLVARTRHLAVVLSPETKLDTETIGERLYELTPKESFFWPT